MLPAMLALGPSRLIHRRQATVHPFAPGNYLTDGRRLFRVVTHFTPRELDPHASLERLTLEVSSNTPRQLYTMGCGRCTRLPRNRAGGPLRGEPPGGRPRRGPDHAERSDAPSACHAERGDAWRGGRYQGAVLL